MAICVKLLTKRVLVDPATVQGTLAGETVGGDGSIR